ncbi:acyl carrier protein [Nocardia sp. NPDC004568]|uniref:acyl carrier protein n=1 Tax=Nocardia sp. NPDC004568 TaxID=3154551 RepID=UPI0033ABD0A7
MDPAWIAVIGTAVGAAGVGGAATVTGWFNRRQVGQQVTGTQAQWHREKRCDAYSAFLDAGVQARDELAGVLRSIHGPGRNAATIRGRLHTADSLVQNVRRSCATVFVLGPDAVLASARRAEEAVVLFQRFLYRTVEDLESGRDPQLNLEICARWNPQIHASLDEFSAATREALGGAAPPPRPSNGREAVRGRNGSATELQWLLTLISSEFGPAIEDIDPKSSLVLHGMSSLELVRIFHRAEVEFGLRRGGLWTIQSMYELTIDELADLIATERVPRS